MFTQILLTANACVESGQIDIGFTQLSWWQILILGMVQGVTELLPISSTAHLRIIPSMLGWADPGSAFSAAMQLASLVAVLSFLGADALKLTKSAVIAVQHRNWSDRRLQIVLGVAVGTLPLAIAGLTLKKTLNSCHSPLRSLMAIGIACIVMAGLLALAERHGQNQSRQDKRQQEDLTLTDGLWVGLAQAFALIPGVSRSGSTLTAGLALGLDRSTAAWFSFLLGLPAITLAGLVEIFSLLKAGLSGEGWLLLLLGLISGSVSAYVALKLLLGYLKDHSSWVFVWYRLGLGVALVTASLTQMLR